MNWTMNLIIGNGISFIAGIFIILSMWVNDPKEAYKYQFLNAFILAISSIFFFSWSFLHNSSSIRIYYKQLWTNWMASYNCYFRDYNLQLLPKINQTYQNKFYSK